MVFKINISEKDGKTYHLELESEELHGKKMNEKISGGEISPDLAGYELEITGMSDQAGLTSMKEVEGIGHKKLLLTYGKAMHKRSKREGKKKRSNPTPGGLRLRKTVRGNTIAGDINQINMKVLKSGNKKLSEIFPDQGQVKSKENRAFKRLNKKSAPKEISSEEAE